MEHSRVEQYRRWFEYEKDSHRKVMASFESVPPGPGEPRLRFTRRSTSWTTSSRPGGCGCSDLAPRPSAPPSCFRQG